MRLLVLVFALLLGGCATVRGPFPSELAQPCVPIGRLGVATNAELADTVGSLAAALRQCNIDKRKLLEWSSQ